MAVVLLVIPRSPSQTGSRMIWPTDYLGKVVQGGCLDVLRSMPDESVNCCITSPPYWGLRDYGVTGQLGLEKTPEEYVAKLVEIFREVRRVLRNDGTLWLNLGDSYAHSTKGTGGGWAADPNNYAHKALAFGARKFSMGDAKPKDLMGIPWRVAFALQSDGWILRQDIIWHKPNPMPESVRDRCTKAHEYIFLLSKSARYYYDADAIKEPSIWAEDNRSGLGNIRYGGKRNGDPGTGQDSFVTITENRNRRSVWTVTTKPFKEAHFATFPPDLIEPCALAGCPESGIILDPFMGAGTTAVVAKKNHRQFIGVELNPAYIEMAVKRIDATLVNRKLQFEAKP